MVYDLLKIIKTAEDFYIIPKGLEPAIALVESGRRHPDGQALGMINKGLSTANMIDAGVMQINIH